MFKSNLSPLNPNKDKYLNTNYAQQNNDLQNISNYHPSNYQYTKGIYNANIPTQYKQQISNQGLNYNAPLSPLSPNITKNPMSPTAKIKMFSNTLTLNKKPSLNTNPILSNQHQNTQDQYTKDPKVFSKMGGKNLTLNLCESIDLKCDQVLEDESLVNHYRKETPQQQPTVSLMKDPYGKRVAKIPVLNFENQMDDLKCDQVLQIKKGQHDESKKNLRFNNSNHHNLSVNDIENNFIYTNMATKNINQGEKVNNLPQGPLTPGYERKKQNPLIPTRKNTDRQYQPNNNSNPSLHAVHPTQQKPRSFTNILSPHPNGTKHNQQQNNEQQNHQSSSNRNNFSETQNQQKTFQKYQIIIEKMGSLLNNYKNTVDELSSKNKSMQNQFKQKYEELREKNQFLQNQNTDLRKCVYGQESKKVNIHGFNNGIGAGRYQGIK